MMKYVMISQDINTYFKKNDVVEVKQVDEKSKLVYVYSKKHNKYQWMMFKDVL